MYACRYLRSQALSSQPAAGAGAFGGLVGANGTLRIAVPPALPSLAVEVCRCSAVSAPVVRSHRAHDCRRAAVGACNRASTSASIIAREVSLARSQHCRDLLAASTVAMHRCCMTAGYAATGLVHS